MRFAAAQLEAMIADGLWLRLAGHANAMAALLAAGLAALPGVALAGPCQANEVFIAVDEALARAIENAGVGAHRWNAATPVVLRLVCAFDSPAADVERMVALVRGLAERAAPAAAVSPPRRA